MQTIEETRRSRLALLEVEAGSQTALAESIGKSPAQVSQWKNASVSTSGRERAMSSDIAREIEHKRGKPRGWMDQPTAPAPLEHVAEPSPPDYRAIRVPLLANGGSMGPGSEELSTDVIVGALSLATDWVSRHVRPSAPAALRFIHAYGDSMQPTLNDGDVLLVDTGVRDPSIDGVYVLRANGRLYVKRVRQRMDGRYEVSSDNPTVKTVDVLDGSQPIDVAGRVIWAWNGANL